MSARRYVSPPKNHRTDHSRVERRAVSYRAEPSYLFLIGVPINYSRETSPWEFQKDNLEEYAYNSGGRARYRTADKYRWPDPGTIKGTKYAVSTDILGSLENKKETVRDKDEARGEKVREVLRGSCDVGCTRGCRL